LEGLRLRKRLGDEAIDFKPYGGMNYFKEDENCYEECMNKLPFINEVLKPFLNHVFVKEIDRFGFNGLGNI
jgi:hypothetical protein